MAIGTIGAALAGGVVTFWLYPKLDGFVLLAAGLAPFLMLGTYLSTRKRIVGIGVGYCIFFCFLAGPDNVIVYDPSGYINNAIALAVSMFVVSVAFAVIIPSDSSWMRRLLLKEMRRQVASACFARLGGLAHRFESGARDLLSQMGAPAGTHDPSHREGMRWLFAVLEIGRAIIDLRGELKVLPPNPVYANSTVWQKQIASTFRSIAAVFDRPSAASVAATLNSTEAAISSVRDVLISHPPCREERHQLQRILSYLHFVRTALLDPQSPFRSTNSDAPTSSEGVNRAP
jgi:uncharacterized membrane protein YccC